MINDAGPDPIRSMVEKTERAIPPVKSSDLIDKAKSSRYVADHRKRRTVQVVTGTAIAAVLTFTVLATFAGQNAHHTQVTQTLDFASPAHEPANEPGKVAVLPASHLHGGQTVQVHAYGFASSTNVEFYQCVRAASPPSTIPMQSAGTTPSTRSWWCAMHTPQTQVTQSAMARKQAGQPTTVASVTMKISTDTSNFSDHINDGGAISPAPDIDCSGPFLKSQCRAGSTSVASQSSSQTSCFGAQGERCVIIAVGKTDEAGTPRVFESDPLDFSDQSPVTTQPQGTIPPSIPGATNPANTLKDCPSTPPDLSRPLESQHAIPQPIVPLLDFAPTTITLCHYPVELESPNATPGSPVTVRDAATIERITQGLNGLGAVPTSATGCTSEGGETVVVLASNATTSEIVTVQFFGCGFAGSGANMRMGAKTLSWIADLT